MALEVATYINQLNASNPVGATDPKGQGDDHLRLIKSVLKNTFPNITGPVTLDQQDINEASFPAGTKMLFVQTAAPVGWTKDVVHNDKALRIVSGAAGTGGTVAFETAFKSQAVVGVNTAVALNASQIPSHTHTQQGTFNSGTESADHVHFFAAVTDVQGQHVHSTSMRSRFDNGGLVDPSWAMGGSGEDYGLRNNNAAGAHAHNVSGNTGGRSAAHFHATTIFGETGAVGGNAAHNHTFTGTAINLDVQYVDCIICTKN